MKAAALALVALGALAAPAHAGSPGFSSPVGKVIQMIADLQAKVYKEGEEAQRVYEEFAELCEERSKDLDFEIKTGKSEVEDLKATIEEETALTASLTTKVEELSASIAADEADLKAATEVRAKENADFVAEEKDLLETIDALERAIAIIERGMKGGASMLQYQGADNLVQAFTTMVQASALSSADAQRLTALVQRQGSDETSLGAPAAAVYEGQSGGIVDTLGDLKDKADTQLEAARGKEQASLFNFQKLKQSLENEIKVATEDKAEATKGIAASGEKKSTAEGDLAVTTKDLNEDITALGDLHHDCMTKANDFEAETKSRGEELAALAKAKEIINEAMSLSQVSLVQVASKITSRMDLANFEAVRFVRDLAKKQNAPALALLAKRMASAVHGKDPFAKIKGLIQDMIEKLEAEAEADASHKAYCDKELGESDTKHAEKTAEIKKLSTKIDSMTAKSAQLKEEVAELQKALAELAASQAEMDKIRQEENAVFKANSAETKKGLNGIKKALKVLSDYYAKDAAHGSAGGAGGGIIGLLEVCESDFSTALAEMVSTEETAQRTYDTETKENEIEKTTKEQDVKYKTKESKDLDKAVAEASSDRSGVQEELDAVSEYLKKLHDQCDEKVEPYAETKRRREAEIAGLKEALEVLESEAALIQRRSSRHRLLRGAPLQ